jgi:hypothetical protein
LEHRINNQKYVEVPRPNSSMMTSDDDVAVDNICAVSNICAAGNQTANANSPDESKRAQTITAAAQTSLINVDTPRNYSKTIDQ